MTLSLPSILLSGFMFPFAGIPQIVPSLAEALPLLGLTALIMTLASPRFRKRLD